MKLHHNEGERLSNASFIHSRSYATDMNTELAAMHAALAEGKETSLKGLWINACAKGSSVISLQQYRAYCKKCQVPSQIDYANIKSLNDIGRRSSSIGTAKTPVPFKKLNLRADVDLHIICDNVSTLLSNKNMHDNGLDGSIQKTVIIYKHLN